MERDDLEDIDRKIKSGKKLEEIVFKCAVSERGLAAETCGHRKELLARICSSTKRISDSSNDCSMETFNLSRYKNRICVCVPV